MRLARKCVFTAQVSVTVAPPGRAPIENGPIRMRKTMELDELFEAAEAPERLSKAALDIDNAPVG